MGTSLRGVGPTLCARCCMSEMYACMQLGKLVPDWRGLRRHSIDQLVLCLSVCLYVCMSETSVLKATASGTQRRPQPP